MKLRTLIPALAIALTAAAANAQVWDGDNAYCREFTKTIYVGGRAQQGYGTSCLQPDGSWQITQEPQANYAQPANYVQPATYVQPVTYVQQPTVVRYVPTAYVHRSYYRPSPFLFSFNYSNNNHRSYWDRRHHNGHNNHHANNNHRNNGNGWNNGHQRGRH